MAVGVVPIVAQGGAELIDDYQSVLTAFSHLELLRTPQ
jgi:hypothetical protein